LTTKEQERRSMRDAAEACDDRLKRSALPRDYALMFRNRTHLSEPQLELLDSAKAHPDVYLHGTAGVGKTSVACVLLAEMIRAGSSGLYVVVPDLMSDLRMLYARSKPGDGLSSSSLIDPMIEAPLLVLDDIGKEKPSEHAATVLFELLDGRYRRRARGRWTCIASNYPPHVIGERFNATEVADPIVRRMTDGATVIEVRS
jgi:DNA replication protein DnaC